MYKELKVCTVGSQIDFISFNNFMVKNGYYSVAGVGAINNVRYNKNVYYTSKSNDYTDVLITFDILSDTYLNDKNNFFLEITGIKIV